MQGAALLSTALSPVLYCTLCSSLCCAVGVYAVQCSLVALVQKREQMGEHR